jgi:hypothetical protein
VRAYLTKDGGLWNIVLPNGITSDEETSGQLDGSFQDATQVAQLRNQGRRYTLLLPLELWIPLFVVAIPLLVVILKAKVRRRKNDVANQ